MRSIGARLTFYYAIAAMASATALFGSGYLMLNHRLVDGLDALNTAEFEQLRDRMGPDYRQLAPNIINERIRQTAEAGSALFFINVDEPHSGMVFYSHNLGHHAIPDVKGKHIYNAFLSGVGNIRVQEFVMPPFDVTIATPMAQVRSSMRSYAEVSVGLLITMLVASAAIGLALARVLLRPLKFIRETAQHISSDNLSERIPSQTNGDELSELAHLLNQMFDRLENSFTQIKRFAAEASHELKTPLSLIRLHAEKMLADDSLPSHSHEAVLVQIEEVDRLSQIIEQMLFLSRAEAGAVPLTLCATSPEFMLRNFEQDALVLAEHHHCNFRLDLPDQAIVAFDEHWLRQVWLNLLSNALAVTPSGGLITMTASVKLGQWQVALKDEGHGLADDQLERIFERFIQFGLPRKREGSSGLGLAIARSIVMLHGGTITAKNRCDRSGLIITVSLPLADQEN